MKSTLSNTFRSIIAVTLITVMTAGFTHVLDNTVKMTTGFTHVLDNTVKRLH